MTLPWKTPADVRGELAARFRARRLAANLSQQGLALRSGVSWGALKHFERTGAISLDSLLKLALVLDCLGDFDQVCAARESGPAAMSLDRILAGRARGRGRLK